MQVVSELAQPFARASFHSAPPTGVCRLNGVASIFDWPA
jgi:hypothetical protein